MKKLVDATPDITNLNEYLKTFDFIHPLLQTKEALTLAAYDVARQAEEENVIYTEIRFAPELSMDKGLTVTEVIAAVCHGLKQAEEEFGIVAKALICGLRQTRMDWTKDIFRETEATDQSSVVGMVFAGNEADFPAEAVEEGILYAQSLGYPMTFHAGECGCVANIAQAIALGVKRTGANISINTDNRTVSDTNLTREYGLFVDYFATSIKDFFQHNQEAIRGSFAANEEKALLLAKLTKAYEPFLEN